MHPISQWTIQQMRITALRFPMSYIEVASQGVAPEELMSTLPAAQTQPQVPQAIRAGGPDETRLTTNTALQCQSLKAGPRLWSLRF